MLAYPIATVAFLLLSQDAVATTGTKKTPTKTDFLRAMNQHSTRRKLSNDAKKDFHKELYGSTKKSAALRKKIMDHSTITKVPGDESAADPELKAKADEGRRKLEQNYNKYNQYNDGTDDYYHASGGYENMFGFDPAEYSVSYHRCATVKQFDDELAATEDSETVFAEKHFAVFRFCPEQTCQGWQMDYEKCGCERQCNKAINQGYTYNNDNGGGGNDDENCLSACYDSCKVWSVQQQLNSNYGGRKLDDENMSGWSNGVYYNKNPWAKHDFDPYFNGENTEVWGARGQGCQSNYGEYMIELEDYLQIMLEYQGERYEEYVEYCENCMQQVYNKWMSQYHGRTLTYEEWKVSEHAEDPRNLAYHYNDDAEYANINYVCEEYDTCREYNQIAEVDEFSEYFECAEVERNNGQVAYVGPVCGSDGYDITLGVFTDENCDVYVGDGVDVSNFVGQEVTDGTLKPYYDSAFGATLEQLEYVNDDQVCIPCKTADLMWDVTMTNMNVDYEQKDVDDDHAQQENNEYNYDDDINELCTNLYMASARCDKHFRAYSSMSKNAKYAQAVAQEDLTCDFIDSVAMGNYGQDGFINVGNDYTVEKSSGWMGNSLYAQEYGHYITEVTPLQIFGLIASILAVGILAVWSATLHKSLSKGGPWKPRRGLRNASPEQPDLTRQNSGVMMGRSASNTSYYMS